MKNCIVMVSNLKPVLRALKYTWLYRNAQLRALNASLFVKRKDVHPMAFVVGCGRSGTTVLGKVLSEHPEVCYRFEPYHLWAALDIRTDAANLFHQGDAQLTMDKTSVKKNAQQLFSCLFQSRKAQMLIEKTPLNVFRISYLKALVPHAKFVHIIRDGVDVSYSIGRLASENTYKIAGKPSLNQWWGVESYRWHVLQRDGKKAGYWPQEVNFLESERQKGAYEWLVSLAEMDRQRAELDGSLLEIVYSDLVSSPEKVLGELCDFLGLRIIDDWLVSSSTTIRPQAVCKRKSISLPQEMASAFNNYQQRYCFSQQANIV